MKFTKLIEKIENLVKRQEKGKRVEPDKLKKLQQLLRKKQSRYREKLVAIDTTEKRKALETKLRVVDAQIAKTQELLSDMTAGPNTD